MQGQRKNSSGESDFSRIPVACCTLSADGAISNCNELFCALFGYTAQEFASLSILRCTDEQSRDLVAKMLGLCGGNSLAMRVWFVRKDGSRFPAQLNAVSFHDRAGQPAKINAVVIDESYNHMMRENALKDNESLRQKEQLKNEFIAIASHELRTPIQPILGFALMAKKGRMSQEVAWDGVLKEARRLQQLANDILDVSRIESNSIEYRMEKVRINEILTSVVDSLKAELKKDLLIELVGSDDDLEIEADRSRITQLITNIAGNAVKFTDRGSVKLQSRRVSSDKIEVKVTDTGCGIPQEMMPRLFGKFVTKSHGEASTNEGTGLGLYICKAIVTAHGGEITAKNNKEGGGTTFTITLPIRQHDDKNSRGVATKTVAAGSAAV